MQIVPSIYRDHPIIVGVSDGSNIIRSLRVVRVENSD